MTINNKPLPGEPIGTVVDGRVFPTEQFRRYLDDTTDEVDNAVPSDHADQTEAHGATGNIVGSGDTATTTSTGVVNQAAAVADITVTGETMSAAYDQTEAQNVSDGLDAVQTKLNDLLSELRTAGILEI